MKKKILSIVIPLLSIFSVLSFINIDFNEVNAAVDEENRIINGNFIDGIDHWTTLHEFDGEANFTVENGLGKIEIIDLGVKVHPEWNVPISWSTQLVQENIPISRGYTYELTFDAYSSQPRPIEIEFTGLSGIENKKFNLDRELQTFTYKFDYSLQSTDFDFKFLLGNVAGENEEETLDSKHVIYLDNISFKPIKELDDSSDNEIDWTLSWNDEFDGDTLDLSKWKYDTGNYIQSNDGEWVSGWGNNELQYYQPDNVYLQNGNLIIEARKEMITDEHDTYNYTSGKITTDSLFSQKYGRFEARMKLPEGQGFWPAFWLMPQDETYGGWASSGEIDIMENRGDQLDIVGAAVHYGGGWPNNVHTAGEYHFPNDSSITDFNVYSLEWEPGELRWYVNDELYYKTNEWYSDQGEYPAPFDQEFYIILNLAVGGWYGLEPNEETIFPSQVEVDYVRVYEGEYNSVTPPEEENPGEDEDQKEPIQRVNPDDYQQIGENLILDGDFNEINTEELLEGRTAWSLHNQGDYEEWAGLASFELVDGVLNSKILQNGWEWWHIQIFQDLSISSGTYLFSLDSKSDSPRNLFVEFVNSGYEISEIQLNETMNSYHYLFTFDEDIDNSQLLFGLGRKPGEEDLEVPYSMYFDNIRLIEVEEIEKIKENELIKFEEELAKLENKIAILEQTQNIKERELTVLKEILQALQQEMKDFDIESDLLKERMKILEMKITQLEEKSNEQNNYKDSNNSSKNNTLDDEGNYKHEIINKKQDNFSKSGDELPKTGETRIIVAYALGTVFIISGTLLIMRVKKNHQMSK